LRRPNPCDREGRLPKGFSVNPLKAAAQKGFAGSAGTFNNYQVLEDPSNRMFSISWIADVGD
jgi:hypothetical protein